MPGRNGTGPRGEGPLSGRGLGYCIVELHDGAESLEKNKEEEVIKMPGGDRTGPMGMGPMTGRGAGYCAGYNMPGYANPMPGFGGYAGGRGYGRGMGRGLGRGRGRGQGFGWYGSNTFAYGAPYGSGKEEAEVLKDQAKVMQEEINAINTRIQELESGTAQGKDG